MFTRSSILTVSVLIIGGFSVGQLVRRVSLPIVSVRFRSEVPYNVEQTKGKLRSGHEVVMVFIGSPHCGFCTSPEMAPLVREAAVSLRERAASDDATPVFVGVATSRVPGEGWKFLERILNFDEVVIGRNWLNSELVELVWSSPSAHAATPQIIVYRQNVVAPSENVRASISREAPTIRVTGIGEIRRWVDAGCPLEWSSGQ